MINDVAIQTPRTRELALEDLAAERAHRLPDEHPAQPQDSIALGARAREQIAGQKAPEICALTFWDHPRRSAPVGPRRLAVDVSASYKLE